MSKNRNNHSLHDKAVLLVNDTKNYNSQQNGVRDILRLPRVIVPTGFNELKEVTSNVTFTIGAVITGDPGSSASASITGTSPNFILNLTIPQGLPGSIKTQGVQKNISEMDAHEISQSSAI